ncbi:hypothetical protein EC973_005357 [Apophysomyces ossiformis]|uniref:DMAP1-binding domain-containing protein n=1 Tax=Apophysomyces ossiformis TaxID=679940 RepID=A0A8H7BKI2_9FUNG|nr:hypothetical protein EC973_005357 [Apophysomyces ossiformis]
MTTESDRDLPPELLEKLRNLELELADGDITHKGFEKKKAILLERYEQSTMANTSEQTHEEDELDLGPEPSAADVVDFLDYLPSPTHSPTRSERGAAYMEEHLQHMQQQSQQQQPLATGDINTPYPQPGVRSSSFAHTAYRPYPAQQQQIPSQQQQWQQSAQQQQQQPMYGQRAADVPVGGQYYYPTSTPRPSRPYARPPYQAQGQGPPAMRPSYGYPQQPPPQPQHQPTQRPLPPTSSAYRPGPPPPPPGSYTAARPMYNRPLPPPQNTSPRPIYRPGMPPPRPNGAYGYRPSPPYSPSQQHARAPTSMEGNHGVPVYGYAGPRPPQPGPGQQPRQSMDYIPTDEARQYGRDQSVEWDSGSVNNWRPSSTGRSPSILSTSNVARFSGSNYSLTETLRERSRSLNRGRSRYGDSSMATTFKAIEAVPQPTLRLEDPMEQMLLADLAGRQMLPIVAREIPFKVSTDDGSETDMAAFTNLAEVLRHRTTTSARATPAFTVVDSRGKEAASLTWEKLNARAEKVAMVIREKSGLPIGDRVALIYRKSEALEFIIAFLGCFLAGMVAVPINAAEELAELAFVLHLSNTHLVLTTDHNLRAFTRDMQARSIEFPKNMEWWKTNDFGSWYPTQPSKSSGSSGRPPIQVPELAYIEYCKATNGELKGVTVTHQTLVHQCRTFKAAATPTVVQKSAEDGSIQVVPARYEPDTVVTYLEPRQQVGLILSVFCSIFAGYHTIFASASIMETPAVWIYVISKYKATIALADYAGLKYATKFYQANPKEVQQHSKKVVPDFASLRLLLIDTVIVNPELNEMIAEKLLSPLGNGDDPLEVVCPIASLPEYGGMILGFRDYLGPAHLEEIVHEQEGEGQEQRVTKRSVLATGHSRDVWECLLDAEALRRNKVVMLAAGEQVQQSQHTNEPGHVRVGSFGFAIPEATVAIVDPETTALCPADTIGEIWVDAPSLSGGFWGLPKHTEAIFHARPIFVPPETQRPEIYEQEFLRTGLVGTVIGGRLVVLGSYEDRIRQQRLGEEFGSEEVHLSSEIIATLNKRARLEPCAIFEIAVNDQHLPILIFESSANRDELPEIANNIADILLGYHGLRLYAMVVLAPNGLPRTVKHGRRQIHPLMTKRAFMTGQFQFRYLKMDVDRTVFNTAASRDPHNDLWRSRVAYDQAIQTGVLLGTTQQPQHTGMEMVRTVTDERTDYDLSRFNNIVDILIWRTSLYPEEVAFVQGSKSYTWRKMNNKIATTANYLQRKAVLRQGKKVLILASFGVDFVQSIYACMVLGVVPVVCALPDPEQHPNRIKEDVGNIVTTLRDLDITYIITNAASEDVLKHKHVSAALKALIPKGFRMPEQFQIGKASRFNKMLGKESGFSVKQEWLADDTLVLVQNSANTRRCYPKMGHDTILAQCKTQKTTCQMKAQRGLVVAGLGAHEGLGLLHAVFCGVYVGCPTVLVSLDDFYKTPALYFELAQRYKAKDLCVNLPLLQYAMNRMTSAEHRPLALHNTQNLMIVTENRPKPSLYQHTMRYFSVNRLEKEAINSVYSHAGNPMITTRSYMLVEPISLVIDFAWLRQGIVKPVLPEEEAANGLLVHDSGIVPSNTMIAIVNPETQMLCPSHVIGEIWVASECNVRGFYGEEGGKFDAVIVGADPRINYMRTGDLGFLWNVQRRVDGQTLVEEGQCLFVLGPISETIEVNGLLHFPVDIESSVEMCHPGITPGGCIVFRIGSETVVVAAVKMAEHALSAVPLIVSAILDTHSFLVDTVVIVDNKQLPRSRYGDKLRGKALAYYMEKKLPAIYVSRITNQHQPLTLPQWSQADNDAASFVSRASVNARSVILDGPHDSDRHSLDQLRRNDTASSRISIPYSTRSHNSTVDSIPNTIA